ncbi:MAG TPA: 2-oxo acid dehydrogenase subunit E2 [Pseudomonadota bacterium]|nr:2-oxo acid dehydrogenase subunit E2 [Pseudomonadota bacterium]
MLPRRSDGFPVGKLSPMRRMMPYILRTRNESCVYFEQRLKLQKTLEYVRTLNERSGANPKHAVNVFHVLLAAAARVFAERPELNRFVLGRRIYQRKHIEFSFAVKKEFSDRGALTTTKLRFSGDESVAEVAQKTREAVAVGRSDKKSQADKEMSVLVWLPGFLLRAILWLQRTLDRFNVLPSALTASDPLYASLFFANLGSIGLDSAYHHLFEYGTVSFFAVLGTIGPMSFVEEETERLCVLPGVSIKYTFDERITDGYYCARSLELLKHYLENPDALEKAESSPS